MKFICEKTSILREISIAQEVIASRTTLSVLSNVLLEAQNNTLFIKATDLKVGFETSIPVEVQTPGSTTIFCDKLVGILRSLPDGEVEFEQKDESLLNIKTVFKKINFQLKSIGSDKFPEIQRVASDIYFEFSQKDFMEMISQTIFAISDDETRYFMNGVYFENNNGELRMVATDGRRLSYISKKVDIPEQQVKGIIVPPKILNLIRKLATGQGTLSLAVTDKNFFVQLGNQKLFSALIEGQFPNYQRVIPDVQKYMMLLKKEDILDALKRVSLLVEQKSRRIFMSVSNNVMQLKSEESEIGVANEEIPCTYNGPDITFAMNYLYLFEPLKIMESEEVSIEFTEAMKAVTLCSVPKQDYFHIIMPMQVD